MKKQCVLLLLIILAACALCGCGDDGIDISNLELKADEIRLWKDNNKSRTWEYSGSWAPAGGTSRIVSNGYKDGNVTLKLQGVYTGTSYVYFKNGKMVSLTNIDSEQAHIDEIDYHDEMARNGILSKNATAFWSIIMVYSPQDKDGKHAMKEYYKRFSSNYKGTRLNMNTCVYKEK